MTKDVRRVSAVLSDRYTVERVLGRGGMATVYLAHDLKHDRKVAIKVLRPDLAASLGLDRFLREIQIAATLHHPNILPLHDSGSADGVLYYVMPYVEGESLRDRLNRERQLPVDDALQIVREIADALSYAHQRGIVHRDIKPENILFQAGHAIVSDFGVARAVTAAGGETLTETGLAVGTPAYMSPEQAAGETTLDGRSDEYALACVLYELLGGEPPHTGATPQAIQARRLSGEVQSLRPIRPAVTSELEAVIGRALSVAPADRYQTCAAFAEAATRSESAAVQERRAVRPRRYLRGIVLAGAVGVVALLAARWLWSPRLAAADRLGVAVFPLRSTGGGADEWSEALADLLATALEGTPGVRVADPWSLWSSLRPSRSARAESPEPGEAARLALRAGVSRYVLGSALQADNRLDVTLRVYEAGRDQPTHTVATAGSLDSLSALVDRLAVDLISRLWIRGAPPGPRPVRGYATESAGALKAYLRAREAMRRGQVDAAEAAIDSALAIDSTFAIALVEAIGIKSWARYMRGEFFQFMDLAERAQQYGDSLPERERLRVERVLASVRTDALAAATAAGRVLEIDSTDLAAWNNLAYYHLVYGWQYGKTAGDALQAADRVVRLDSTFVPGLVIRLRFAVLNGDSVDAARQVRRIVAVDSTTVIVRSALLASRAVLASDSAFASLVDTVAAAAPREWLAAFRELRILRPDRAHMLVERIRRTAAPGFSAGQAERSLARLWIGHGRTRHVDSLIQQGEYRRNDFYRTLQHFLVTAAFAGTGDSTAARRAVDALAEYLPVDSASVLAEQREVWWTGWVIGAYHAMFGDTTISRQWQTALGKLPLGGTSKDYRGALQRDLEARLAARQGDIERALASAHEAYDLWTIHTENDHEALPAPAIRFQLAMLLREADRPDSAEALFRSVSPPGTWMGALTARASLEIGRLAEQRGDLEAAASAYGMSHRMWEQGGAEVAGWREDARAGLDRAVRGRG